MNNIDETVKKLWPIIPNWINYIAIDFDGEVWGFDLYPKTELNYKKLKWSMNGGPKNRDNSHYIMKMNLEFPNWKELIFQRPSSSPTTENQLTPLLQRLRDYLDNTPRKQIEADWTQVKSLGLHGSPNCDEFIKTFKR
jgi:hypothetical protein